MNREHVIPSTHSLATEELIDIDDLTTDTTSNLNNTNDLSEPDSIPIIIDPSLIESQENQHFTEEFFESLDTCNTHPSNISIPSEAILPPQSRSTEFKNKFSIHSKNCFNKLSIETHAQRSIDLDTYMKSVYTRLYTKFNRNIISSYYQELFDTQHVYTYKLNANERDIDDLSLINKFNINLNANHSHFTHDWQFSHLSSDPAILKHVIIIVPIDDSDYVSAPLIYQELFDVFNRVIVYGHTRVIVSFVIGEQVRDVDICVSKLKEIQSAIEEINEMIATIPPPENETPPNGDDPTVFRIHPLLDNADHVIRLNGMYETYSNFESTVNVMTKGVTPDRIRYGREHFECLSRYLKKNHNVFLRSARESIFDTLKCVEFDIIIDEQLKQYSKLWLFNIATSNVDRITRHENHDHKLRNVWDTDYHSYDNNDVIFRERRRNKGLFELSSKIFDVPKTNDSENDDYSD